jgi:Spy/CpxP family protein refolding chaperone
MMFIWRSGGTESIADKVAIIGMGCMTCGESWEKSAEGMIVDAVYEAFEDAGASPQDIQAASVGTTSSGSMGQSLSRPLKDHTSDYRGADEAALAALILIFLPICRPTTRREMAMAGMKSAVELAMEKLGKRHAQDDTTPLSDEQRQEIGDMRKQYEAKIAEKEIMLQADIRRLVQRHPPHEAAAAAKELQEKFQEARKALQQELEEKIAMIRARA